MALLGRFSETVFGHVGRFSVYYVSLGALLVALFGAAYVSLDSHYRMADQVPDREEALSATGRLDQKLTGANPVHIMVRWSGDRSLYSEEVLDVIGATHRAVESHPAVGNVWSIETLRQWLAGAGEPSLEALRSYVEILPEHLTRRFVTPEQNPILITGRIPDIDASEILPVMNDLEDALAPLRAAHPDFEIVVTGLPAIAARNSAQMIWELNVGLMTAIVIVIVFLAIAFQSIFVGVVSIPPALFPICATGAFIYVTGAGLHFATMIALTVAFGLALHANVHFLNRFDLEEVDERGAQRPTAEALRRTARFIGPVMILTTTVLALGLGVTVLSELPSLRLFGQLTAITLLAALLAQIVIFPATIAFGRKLLHRW